MRPEFADCDTPIPIREIVIRAATLRERLKRRFIRTATPTERCTGALGTAFEPEPTGDDPLVDARLARWRQVVAPEDPSRFQRRLEMDGLDIEMARRALGPVCLREGQPLPPWARTLNLVLRSYSRSYSPDDEAIQRRCLDPLRPVPFEELLMPFLAVASREIESRAAGRLDFLAEGARAALERHLLRRLADLSAQPLALEFSLFQAPNCSALSRFLTRSASEPSREGYLRFIAAMRGGDIVEFFREYSVLARLMATAVDHWIEGVAEFLERLERDWGELTQVFAIGNASGGPSVAEVEPGLSDSHDGGRTVMACTFAGGVRLVYKPRGLGLERAYFHFLEWLNEQGAMPSFATLRVLDRTTYGWEDRISQRPCHSSDQARLYYRRAGMLLCVVYALEGMDCHAENIVASGEWPLLVDAEMLLYPRTRDERPDRPDDLELPSVLRAGLLPGWDVGAGGLVYDVGGLGGTGDFGAAALAWRHINTDEMAPAFPEVKRPSSANLLSLDGVVLEVAGFVAEVVDGFQQIYSFLSERRQALLAEDGPLAALARHPVRFGLRPTALYDALLRKLLHPEYLRLGVERSIQLDVLSRALIQPDNTRFWPLLALEVEALERSDIPRFTVPADGDGIPVLDGSTIPRCFQASGYNSARARIAGLDRDDCTRQIEFIRAAFTSGSAGAGRAKPISTIETTSLPDPAGLVQQALKIGLELEKRAIDALDGGLTWIAPFFSENRGFRLQPVGHSLYDGRAGIALFLAALARASGRTRFRDLALATLQPLRQALQTSAPTVSNQTVGGIGGGTGTGGLVYALARIAALLDLPELLDDASRAAAQITTERIEADAEFDVLSGSAGAALGLLALHGATGDRSALDRARACGDHLLRNQVPGRLGGRAWPTRTGGPLAGFSHGAAGIAYALTRLYEALGKRALLGAAADAVAYERTVFSLADANWPDLRAVHLEPAIPGSQARDSRITTPNFVVRWCHGAAGIGLARLGGLRVLDTPEIRHDIDIALGKTLAFGVDGIDHLCCGNFGRIEALLVGDQTLSRSDYWNAAQRRAAWLVSHIGDSGAYRCTPELPGQVFHPGFFKGASGIGYELLRLAQPDRIPSVLLWQ